MYRKHIVQNVSETCHVETYLKPDFTQETGATIHRNTKQWIFLWSQRDTIEAISRMKWGNWQNLKWTCEWFSNLCKEGCPTILGSLKKKKSLLRASTFRTWSIAHLPFLSSVDSKTALRRKEITLVGDLWTFLCHLSKDTMSKGVGDKIPIYNTRSLEKKLCVRNLSVIIVLNWYIRLSTFLLRNTMLALPLSSNCCRCYVTYNFF